MNKVIAVLALSVACIVPTTVSAAPSTQLKVTGAIKTPSCELTFDGGGVVDFGVIPAASLKAKENKVLPVKEVGLRIHCPASTRLAIKTRDNRAASLVTGVDNPFYGRESNQLFGLGVVRGKKVGNYMAHINNRSVKIDGQPGRMLFRTYMGWTGAASYMTNDNSLHSWSSGGSTYPGAFKEFAGQLEISASLQKPEKLPLEQEVPLDGSITFELVYL